jgi:hypothetical protein
MNTMISLELQVIHIIWPELKKLLLSFQNEKLLLFVADILSL